MGSLDAPNHTFLVNCHPLDSGRNVNSSIILHTVDDILRQLELRYACACSHIDEVIATIKNKDHKKDFHDAGLPSPPDPVITRWATWLRAALYYCENLLAVRIIVTIGQVQASQSAEQKTLSMWKVSCRTWFK